VKRVLALVSGALLTALVLWLASIGLVLLAGSRPQLRPADAILVLGAAQYNGRPSPVLRARLDHALDLYHRGLAPRLIFTGGVGAGDTLSEGQVARSYALDHDVPDSVIQIDSVGVTSAESVEEAARLMRSRGWSTALIVSDSYHMLRLELLARFSGIRAYRAPTPSGPIDRDRRIRRHYVLRESLLFPASVILGAR